MKIRVGFVSNSSSSSFCFKGICIVNSVIKFEDDDEDCDIGAALEDVIEKTGCDFLTYDLGGDECGCLYIGVDYEDIGEDETGREFTERVQAACDKVCDILNIEREKVSQQSGEYYS